MTKSKKSWLLAGVTAVVLAGAILFIWQSLQTALPAGFSSGNGRIEATEIDIATKIAGRVEAIMADEGDSVSAGQILAKLDTGVLEAQLREAQARLRQSMNAIETARTRVIQRQGEKAAANALILQRKAELDVAQKHLQRSESLVREDAIAVQQLDDDQATFLSAQAVLRAAESQLVAADAAIATAKSQAIEAESDVAAAQATVERIQVDIDDSVLKAPRDGRVQYRVAQPGEVLGAGGKVLNMVDLSEVYMTFFLPTVEAGQIAMGSEVRLVLDAAPQYVIPAHVSLVSDVAQFTPKTVETASEREKLMFRIKAQIPAELLRKHITQVKTGLPGVAYVRLDPQAQWPAYLQVNLPQ